MVTKTTTAVGEWENPKKSGWTALMMMNSISLYGHLNVTAKDLSLLPPPPPFFLQTFRYSLWVFFCIHTSSCFWGKDLFSCFRVIGLILCPADAAGAPAGKANGDSAGRRGPGAPAGTRLEDPPCRPEVPQRRSEHQRCRRRRRQQRRPR